jgi:hypothetical protein
MTLDQEDIQAIAQAVVAGIRANPADADARLTRTQAAQALGVSPSSFDRMRATVRALKPVSQSPVRWSRRQIELFKLKGLQEALA